MSTTIEEHELPGFIAGVVAEVEAEIRQIDFGPAMFRCANLLRRQEQEVFAARRSPEGLIWEEWHFRRPEADDNHPTLHDTGALLESVTQGQNHIENIDRDSLEYGTSLPYANTHQYGAITRTDRLLVARGGGFAIPAGSLIHIPRRPFLSIAERTLNGIVNIIADHVVAELRV